MLLTWPQESVSLQADLHRWHRATLYLYLCLNWNARSHVLRAQGNRWRGYSSISPLNVVGEETTRLTIQPNALIFCQLLWNSAGTRGRQAPITGMVKTAFIDCELSNIGVSTVHKCTHNIVLCSRVGPFAANACTPRTVQVWHARNMLSSDCLQNATDDEKHANEPFKDEVTLTYGLLFRTNGGWAAGVGRDRMRRDARF